MGAPSDWSASVDPTIEDDPTANSDEVGRRDTAPMAAATSALEAGDRVGRYQLEALLGAGAMGQVWRARDPQLDRTVAIKVVHPAIARSPDGANRLLREARAMAKLSHPNVVAVHDAGNDRGRVFVAMELVDGATLTQAIAVMATPRDWREVLPRFIAAGRGLAAAHAAGILHRDFKPDNVLIDRGGRVCVGDFGLAAFGRGPEVKRSAVVRGRTGTVDGLTVDGLVMGTPAYMSPEQLHGSAIDARADQFGFAVALYEALYGEHPFVGGKPASLGALVEAVVGGVVRPAPVGDRVPRWLRDAVVRGLASEPAQRWPTMDAMLTALAGPRRVVPPLLALATAIVVVAAVVAALVVVRRGHSRATPALTAIPRFDVSLRARVAASPDGRRLAVSTMDRIEVRDDRGATVWSYVVPSSGRVGQVQFADADRVLFARETGSVITVDLSTGRMTAGAEVADWNTWLARLDAGDVRTRGHAERWEVGIEDHGQVRVLVKVGHRPDVVSVAPSRRRVAIIDDDRYAGRVVVLDARGVVAETAPIPALTAVAWETDARLLFATGSVEHPTLWSAELVGGAIGPWRPRYRAPRGWFGQLVTGGGRLWFVDSGATFRARAIARVGATRRTRDLDTGIIGGALGWSERDAFLAWNRTSGAIERYDARGLVAATPARLDGEAANATVAGDIVIAALRRDDGRELVAVSLTDGAVRWRKPTGFGRAVRCAGDRQPPCVVIDDAVAPGPIARLRRIDPQTGEVDAPFGPVGRVDDVAINADGSELLVSDGGASIAVIDATGAPLRSINAGLAVRAVAYDPTGGALVAGTGDRGRYQLLHVDDAGTEVLLDSNNEILFQPRPAPSGGEVLVMGRLLLPGLYELVAAPAR